MNSAHNSRTRFCADHFLYGTCPYSEDTCQYAHAVEVLQPLPEAERKLQLCSLYDVGCCPATNSALCNFAHGRSQLRCVLTSKATKQRIKKRILMQPPTQNSPPEPLPATVTEALATFLYCNEGISLSVLPVQFTQETGKSLCYKDYGFLSLEDFLRCGVYEIVKLKYSADRTRVYLRSRVRRGLKRKLVEQQHSLSTPILELDPEGPSYVESALDCGRSLDDKVEQPAPAVALQQELLKKEYLVTQDQLAIPLHYKAASRVICGYCHRVLSRNFVLLQCGHLHCSVCVSSNLDHQRLTCATCGKTLSFETSPDSICRQIRPDSPSFELFELFYCVQETPVSCFIAQCPWENRPLSAWPRHAMVCPLLRTWKAVPSPENEAIRRGGFRTSSFWRNAVTDEDLNACLNAAQAHDYYDAWYRIEKRFVKALRCAVLHCFPEVSHGSRKSNPTAAPHTEASSLPSKNQQNEAGVPICYSNLTSEPGDTAKEPVALVSTHTAAHSFRARSDSSTSSFASVEELSESVSVHTPEQQHFEAQHQYNASDLAARRSTSNLPVFKHQS